MKLYNKNEAFIISAAKRIAEKYHCLRLRENGRGYSRYTRGILEELKNEGTLEFFRLLRQGDYDSSKGKLTTYLYPYLDGVMRWWIEKNIGVFSFDKANMDLLRKIQHDYFLLDESTEQLAEKYKVPEKLVARFLLYNTHTVSLEDVLPVKSGDPENREILWEPGDGQGSSPIEYVTYRNLCYHYLQN